MAFRVYRAAFNYRSEFGVRCANILHFGGDDSSLDWSPTTAQGLADHVGSGGLVTMWRDMLDSSQVFDDVTVTEMLPHGSTALPGSGIHLVNAAGTAAWTGDLPAQMCGLIAIKTGIPKRYARGWWFMPPIQSEAHTAAGKILTTSDYWVSLQNVVTELGHWNKNGSAFPAGSWGVGVYSRTRHNQGVSPFFFHAVGYKTVNDVHWLRSRGS